MTRTAALFAALLFVAACGNGPTLAEGADANLITRAEIDQSVNSQNARELVERLRPRWLVVRGTGNAGNIRTAGDSPGGIDAEPVSVYVNGSRRGTSETLAGIARIDIESMQYFNPAQANLRFGATNGFGAIAVTLRSAP